MIKCEVCGKEVFSYIRDKRKDYCIPCHDEIQDKKEKENVK